MGRCRSSEALVRCSSKALIFRTCFPLAETYARLMKLGYSFPVRRRGFLATIGSLAAFSVVSGSALRASAEPRKGRLKQGVCLGVFSGTKLDMEGKCREAARLGAYGIDLVGPNEFPLLKQYGLVPTMVPGGTGIHRGCRRSERHCARRGSQRNFR
jgi:hypothetical protein